MGLIMAISRFNSYLGGLRKKAAHLEIVVFFGLDALLGIPVMQNDQQKS